MTSIVMSDRPEEKALNAKFPRGAFRVGERRKREVSSIQYDRGLCASYQPTTVHFENRNNGSKHPASAMLRIHVREKDV